MIITPKLRGDVSCFDRNECYPLAFGLPAVLMIIAVVIFVLGKSSYIIKIPTRNVLWDVCKVLYFALRNGVSRWRRGSKQAF